MFADAVLGAGDSNGTCVSQGKKMPAMVDALSGKPLQQDITIDMSEAAKYGKKQSDALRKGLLHCFIADLDTKGKKERRERRKEPGSYNAGLKDPHQCQHRIDGDGVERKRIIDFEAYTSVQYAEADATGEYIGHILRIVSQGSD